MTKASPTIGGGHVLRCLGLAEALQRGGIRPVFAVSRLTLETVDLLASGSFDVLEIDEHGEPPTAPARIVIFDSYDWDSRVESRWAGRGLLRVVIDDLADRSHDCEVLVDPTPGRQIVQYAGLIPKQCEVLAGPSFALLRPAFERLRHNALQRRSDGYPRRMLISMGLTDVRGITRTVAEGAILADPHWEIDVVVGQRAESLPWLRATAARLRATAARGRLNVHVDLDSLAMAELMAAADLAVGGGGGTSLERCCMGLPSLVILLAENQRMIAETLRDSGAVRLVGELANATPELVADALRSFSQDGAQRLRCAQRAASVVDGKGADRVCQAIVRKLG